MTNCVKFGAIVTTIFAKSRQKRLLILSVFAFLPFWPHNISWSAKYSINWGYPSIMTFFIRSLFLPWIGYSKSFWHFWAQLLYWNFVELQKLCQISPQTFWTESVLVFTQGVSPSAAVFVYLRLKWGTICQTLLLHSFKRIIKHNYKCMNTLHIWINYRKFRS